VDVVLQDGFPLHPLLLIVFSNTATAAVDVPHKHLKVLPSQALVDLAFMLKIRYHLPFLVLNSWQPGGKFGRLSGNATLWASLIVRAATLHFAWLRMG